MTKPNILSKEFRYTKAANQTVDHMRALFKKERDRLKEQAERETGESKLRLAAIGRKA